MLKKSLVVMMMGGFISALTAFPVLASNWVIDPSTYELNTRDNEWLKAEALAEIKQWTDARKDAIAALPTDVDKYEAIVKAVCDFLEYDSKYAYPHISYTLRDGKGVCADYTILTKSLCDAVGIKCTLVFGNFANDAHDWVKVTLMGKEYYSDVTQVDAGMPAYKLSSVLWSDHIETRTSDKIEDALLVCGSDINDSIDSLLATPAGYVECITPDGRPFYVTQADVDALSVNAITFAELMAKYGMN